MTPARGVAEKSFVLSIAHSQAGLPCQGQGGKRRPDAIVEEGALLLGPLADSREAVAPRHDMSVE